MFEQDDIEDRYIHGFTDRRDEGNFEWTDGSCVDFTNWRPNEPNNLGNEDCTHAYVGGIWNDLP